MLSDELILHTKRKIEEDLIKDEENEEDSEEKVLLEKLSKKDEDLVEKAKATIPDIKNILEQAVTRVKKDFPTKLSPKYSEKNFGECAALLESAAFQIYLLHQRTMFLKLINEWIAQNENELEELYRKCKSAKEYSQHVLKKIYPLIQRLEFDAGQMRKSRGGKTFEHVVEHLLTIIDMPWENPSKEGKKKLKRIDLVVPSQDLALRRPDQAFFLSCKRTLRERWKQTIPERKPSWRVFLLTLDEELSLDKAEEINELGMIIYVLDKVKSEAELADKDWIRRLSDLPKDLRR